MPSRPRPGSSSRAWAEDAVNEGSARGPDAPRAGLHPAFRIMLLVALAAMLFRYSLPAMTIVLAILLAGAAGAGVLRRVARSIRRIRWLLLSIAVIYLWVAPEPAAGGAIPAWPDVELALRRAGVLVVLVAAVELLTLHTPAPLMAAGLVTVLRPLRILGVDVERFAGRLALTLEAVPATAEKVAEAAGGRRIRRGIAGWGEAAADLVERIETDANAGPQAAALPDPGRAGLTDWLALAAGVAAVIALGAL